MRRWLGRAALVLGGLVLGSAVALIGAELATRMLAKDPVQDTGLMADRSWNQDCVQPTEGSGYEYRPGACGANSLGLLGKEPAPSDGSDALRVLVLGDSIAADRLFPELLQTGLSRELERPVLVLNAGVPGYATGNELGWLRRHGRDLQPDLVVLQFCTNDYGFTPFLFRYQGRVLQVEDTSGAMTGRSLWLFEHSTLYRWTVVAGLSRSASGSGSRDFDFQQQAPKLDQVMLDLVDDVADMDVPFLVAVFPPVAAHADWPPREAQTWSRIKILLAQHDVAAVDLDPIFQQGEVRDLRRVRAAATLQDLDRIAAERGLDRHTARQLARLPSVQASVQRQPKNAPDRDFTHPNFLGHYLAARAIQAAIMERWGDDLVKR